MRVVVDTNVLVSAVLRDKDPEAVILWIANQPGVEWLVSTSIMKEYLSVLARSRFGIPQEILQKWDTLLKKITREVQVVKTFEFPRDQKDAAFLACALSTQANYLITGDKDFLEARQVVDTIIISVGMFKRLVCDRLGEL